MTATEDCFLSSGQHNQLRMHLQSSTHGAPSTNGVVGDASDGDEVAVWGCGGQWDERGKGMTLCLSFSVHSCFVEKERLPASSAGFFSKGEAAFLCQCGSSWVKSVVVYKSVLCLGAVDLRVAGARGKVQVAARRQQPVDVLQTKPCISAYSNAEI